VAGEVVASLPGPSVVSNVINLGPTILYSVYSSIIINHCNRFNEEHAGTKHVGLSQDTLTTIHGECLG